MTATEGLKETELRCHLHRKPQKACKFCLRALGAKKEAEEAKVSVAKKVDTVIPLRRTFNCSQLLIDQVLNSSYYQTLELITDFDALVEEMRQFANDTIDVYRAPTEPSGFICNVYRLFTLNHTEEQLRTVIDCAGAVHVRCVGFVFLRYTLPPEQLWEYFEEFVLDEEELRIKDDGHDLGSTIGEFVEALTLKEKYFSMPLPRIPVAVRRKLEEQIAPLSQYRKRTRANLRIFGPGRAFGTKVEALVSGQWKPGKVLRFMDQVPTRVKLLMALEEDDEERVIDIGRIVLVDSVSLPERRSRTRSRSTGRRRNRQPDSKQDWSRWKGKSDSEMVEELRERQRQSAVCNDRTKYGYSRRPLCFEGSLAIKRDLGSAEARQVEEDTQIAISERRKRMAEEEEEEKDRRFARRSDEEEERQRRLKDIYEKYGSKQKAAAQGTIKRSDVEGPDVMRLG